MAYGRVIQWMWAKAVARTMGGGGGGGGVTNATAYAVVGSSNYTVTVGTTVWRFG